MVTKVQKWGNSQGLRLTKTMMAEARISVGDPVTVRVQTGRIVIEPSRKVRGGHDLKALVAAIPHGYRAAETNWGPPVGKEAW